MIMAPTLPSSSVSNVSRATGSLNGTIRKESVVSGGMPRENGTLQGRASDPPESRLGAIEYMTVSW
jgi:hypothetical protein